MKKNKIQVYNGVGSFVEPKKVKVENGEGTEELEAEHILISTGSAVSTLPGLEFDGEKVISSDNIVTNDEWYPESIIILGSGAVGVEFASMYKDFGAEVTIVEVLDRLVPSEDPEISAELTRSFERRGIRILTGSMADPDALEKTDDGVRIKISAVGQEKQEEEEEKVEECTYGDEPDPVGEAEDDGETLEAEALLVAIGSKTVIENLNLDATSVELNDRNEIQVDEFYRTS